MRIGIANVFIMHMCIEYAHMCFAACLGLGDTHPPIRLETTYACGIINSSSTAEYLNKCSFSIGFFKAAHIVSEFYLNSLWVQQSYGNQSKCWNVQPSCSSHHVECTKTWMRDVSSVLWGDRTLFYEVRQPTHTCPAEHPKQEQSNGSWW